MQVYKTKSGRNRHVKAKHGNIPVKLFTTIDLKMFIEETRCKIFNNFCYPPEIRNEFTTELNCNLNHY